MTRTDLTFSSTLRHARRPDPADGVSGKTLRTPPWKRTLDVICIISALPVLLPLSLVIASFIKLVSPGPVLFKQERVGLGSRRFMCFKFRTMHVGADTGVHRGHLQGIIQSNRPMTKLDTKDPRLIRFGLVLRSLGLDEIPQLLNVLRGEMSLVGPRPCIPYEFDQFLPRHRQRCDTLPGMTGLWQVSGKNRTTFEEMMDMDIYYAHHKSLLLDLTILARTIPAIIVQAWEVKVRKRSLRPASLQAVPRPSASAE